MEHPRQTIWGFLSWSTVPPLFLSPPSAVMIERERPRVTGIKIEWSAGSFPLIPWIRRSVHASMILHFCCLRSFATAISKRNAAICEQVRPPVPNLSPRESADRPTGQRSDADATEIKAVCPYPSGQFSTNSLFLWIRTNRMWLIQWFVSRSLNHGLELDVVFVKCHVVRGHMVLVGEEPARVLVVFSAGF